jgi:hypothetical protein
MNTMSTIRLFQVLQLRSLITFCQQSVNPSMSMKVPRCQQINNTRANQRGGLDHDQAKSTTASISLDRSPVSQQSIHHVQAGSLWHYRVYINRAQIVCSYDAFFTTVLIEHNPHHESCIEPRINNEQHTWYQACGSYCRFSKQHHLCMILL